MPSRFKAKRTWPNCASLDTHDKLAAAARSGHVVRLLLTPTEFGGMPDEDNLVYVPAWVAGYKAMIDRDAANLFVAYRGTRRCGCGQDGPPRGNVGVGALPV